MDAILYIVCGDHLSPKKTSVGYSSFSSLLLMTPPGSSLPTSLLQAWCVLRDVFSPKRLELSAFHDEFLGAAIIHHQETIGTYPW
jgi:hypothetical protein